MFSINPSIFYLIILITLTVRGQEQRLADAKEGVVRDHTQLFVDRDLNRVKGVFTEKEADIYRNSDHIIIRIKSIVFAEGNDELNSRSKEVLAKVKKLLKKIDESEVMIEGMVHHTKSKLQPMILTDRRAHNIAKFLKEDEPSLKNRVTPYGQGGHKNQRLEFIISTRESL